MIPYNSITTVEKIETPLSNEMEAAINTWYKMYTNNADWIKDDDGNVSSMNLASFISSEVARSVLIEMKWNITAKDGAKANEDGSDVTNPRSEFLKKQFGRCMATLQEKLELSMASGGMVIKPYIKDKQIHFDFVQDWSLYPIAFDDEGNLSDVIFRDGYTEGKTYYTRLERHKIDGNKITITQRAFKSSMPDTIGTEVALSSVDIWADLEPEIEVKATDGMLFGWYKVAQANTVDPESPMGAAIFSRAVDAIRDCDERYSQFKWEYDGSELAIDVDPFAMKQSEEKGELPRHADRLFRKVDVGNGDTYKVFSPPIRDANIIRGINEHLKHIEDLCGLSRGTLSDVSSEARTATELHIMKHRSYSTVHRNQEALERCLKEVIRVMDKLATLYSLAGEGEYDVSFEWDDSIITDTETEAQQKLVLVESRIMSQVEFRMWYFGETEAQAKKAVLQVAEEQAELQKIMMQSQLAFMDEPNANVV